ncbi:MAG TPA: ABC transporter permease [Candidatus Saccharimonadales bacterium]|nr:ABC transporter permease [Candidatus Saccharimonadales bacterium]
MNYGEVFITAINSLRSNVLRTALTMLGIIIGIFAVTLVLIISQGATAAITSKISSLGTNLLHIANGPTGQLTDEDAKAIAQQVPGVVSYDEVVSKNGTVAANGQTTGVALEGVTPSLADILSLTIDKGAFFTDDDVSSYASIAVLGTQVVTDLFGEGSNPVGQYVQVGGKSFYVVGVLASKGAGIAGDPDHSIYIPVTTAMSVISGSQTLDSIDILAKNQDDIDTMAKEIKQLLLDRYNVTDPLVIQKYTIYTSKDLLATVSSITGILSGVLAGIAAISLLVGGIGIMNIMLVTVTERTKEIGLLKAIGAKQQNILVQFLIESVVLTVSGGLIGTLLGIGVGVILSNVLKVPFTPPVFSIFIAVLVSIMIGLIFGIYPAQKAAKMSPIDALRFE